MSFLSKLSAKAEPTKVAVARTAPSMSRGKATSLPWHGLALLRAKRSSRTALYRKSRGGGRCSLRPNRAAENRRDRCDGRQHADRASMEDRLHSAARLAQSIRATSDAVSIARFPPRRRECGHVGAAEERGRPFVAARGRGSPSSPASAWLTHRDHRRSTAILSSSSIGPSRPLKLPASRSPPSQECSRASYVRGKISSGRTSGRKTRPQSTRITNTR